MDNLLQLFIGLMINPISGNRGRTQSNKPKIECRLCKRTFVMKSNGQPWTHKCVPLPQVAAVSQQLDEQKELLAYCRMKLEELFENRQLMTDEQYRQECAKLQRRHAEVTQRIEQLSHNR